MTGQSIRLDVERNDTIQTVKERYSGKSGNPTSHIGLMFAGKYLEDERTLSDYNIRRESIIHHVMPRHIISMRRYNSKPTISPSMIHWSIYNDPIICQFKAVYSDQHYTLAIFWMGRQCAVTEDNLPIDVIKMMLLYLQHVPKKLHVNDLDGLPRRIQREIFRIPRDSHPGIVISLHPENYRHFLFKIEGPKDGPYEGGIFYVEMFLDEQYPMKPPKCLFRTPTIHPCIFPDGRFYLDVLKIKWTPAFTVTRVAMSIQLMLMDLEPWSWKSDDPEFDIKKEAKKATLKYATF